LARFDITLLSFGNRAATNFKVSVPLTTFKGLITKNNWYKVRTTVQAQRNNAIEDCNIDIGYLSFTNSAATNSSNTGLDTMVDWCKVRTTIEAPSGLLRLHGKRKLLHCTRCQCQPQL